MEIPHIIPAATVNVAPECLEQCNGLRDIPADERERRLQRLGMVAESGCDVLCSGPTTGQYHPICRLPEESKVALRSIAQAEPASADTEPHGRKYKDGLKDRASFV